MAFFVIRESDALSRALDISIVIDGVEVLNELPSVACACAMMFGLIYALNLKYPEGLKYTFEAFQKIIMDIEMRRADEPKGAEPLFKAAGLNLFPLTQLQCSADGKFLSSTVNFV